jgi:hypothetical protein
MARIATRWRIRCRGEAGARQLRELQPVMGNIQAVLSDVHDCIRQWCADHPRGAIATVLRNLGASTWFQEAFLDLNRRLSDAYADLGLALNIQHGAASRPTPRRCAAACARYELASHAREGGSWPAGLSDTCRTCSSGQEPQQLGGSDC